MDMTSSSSSVPKKQIQVQGFDISTSKGPIADEAWYNRASEELESLAQHVLTSDDRGATDTPVRKLSLPEMVFPTVQLSIRGYGLGVNWNAWDALKEWAAAHSEIPIHSSELSSSGVSVLKAQDAKLWEAKKKKSSDSGEDVVDISHIGSSQSVFHYDWSFSTPYVGSIAAPSDGKWEELKESGMRMNLLTDTTVPILFFDEITLFEDDLHDNGEAKFTVKIRVMPTCAFVLARLWLCVDNVLVRLRETRLLVDFFACGADEAQPAIFRDVSWRECSWSQLKSHQLPTNLRLWHVEQQETAEWQQLLRRIPTVELPKGILKFAALKQRNNGP